ncbi:gamma-glutamylcyclotransferase [Methylococcaceae bacterium]|nr:gamma-glutamylcyclotransferase [Methylococcaceae bacterium]
MYLFVYGTLRKSSNHTAHELLGKNCIYQSDGYFYGKLYDLGDYPAAIQIENASEKVFGELYRIINAKNLFERLDDYEECDANYPMPHEYLRKMITVYDQTHQPFQAWCYLYNLSESL